MWIHPLVHFYTVLFTCIVLRITTAQCNLKLNRVVFQIPQNDFVIFIVNLSCSDAFRQVKSQIVLHSVHVIYCMSTILVHTISKYDYFCLHFTFALIMEQNLPSYRIQMLISCQVITFSQHTQILMSPLIYKSYLCPCGLRAVDKLTTSKMAPTVYIIFSAEVSFSSESHCCHTRFSNKTDILPRQTFSSHTVT